MFSQMKVARLQTQSSTLREITRVEEVLRQHQQRRLEALEDDTNTIIEDLGSDSDYDVGVEGEFVFYLLAHVRHGRKFV